jgi:hypothetical protein
VKRVDAPVPPWTYQDNAVSFLTSWSLLPSAWRASASSFAYLCMYFVVRLKEHTVTGLSGVAGVLVEGVVGKFLTANTAAGPDTIWRYLVGLLAGLVAWVVLRIVDPEARARRAAAKSGSASPTVAAPAWLLPPRTVSYRPPSGPTPPPR